MRKGLIVFVLSFIATAFVAQQDIQLTHFTFDRLSINPGYAGSKQAICATGIYRQQWVGFDGAPTTTLLNAHMPLTRQKIGIGISFIGDELGQETTNFVKGSVSKQFSGIGKGKLGLGLSLGVIAKKLDNDWVSIDPFESDEAIPDNGTSASALDLGFGAYYYTAKTYLGISATHLSEGDLKDMNYAIARHYYLMAGHTASISAKVDIEPSVLVKTDASATTFDLNVRGIYNDFVWLGVSFRLDDAISPMAGINYNFPDGRNSIKVGYAYDITTSEIKNHSTGTNEIMLNFCQKLFKPLPKKVYKNVRFL